MATRFFPNYKSYIITSPFGVRIHPVTKIKKQHNGIDLVATNDGKVGQTDYLLAHTAGTVESVGYDLSAGNFIKIRVDKDTIMVYYHMKNKSELKKGATVKKGDRLGYMGKTGTATGAHLHFGIKYKNSWIDPEPYLNKNWSAPVEPKKMVTISVPVLSKGAKGEDVKALQILLNARLAGKEGFDILDTDGSFGNKTETAVKFFQKTYGLDQDGCCGPASWTKLINLA
jgi:hypothetical protein